MCLQASPAATRPTHVVRGQPRAPGDRSCRERVSTRRRQRFPNDGPKIPQRFPGNPQRFQRFRICKTRIQSVDDSFSCRITTDDTDGHRYEEIPSLLLNLKTIQDFYPRICVIRAIRGSKLFGSSDDPKQSPKISSDAPKIPRQSSKIPKISHLQNTDPICG